MFVPKKSTVTKFFLKGIGYSLTIAAGSLNIMFFNLILPYICDSLLGLEYSSDEYEIFYKVNYVCSMVTFIAGALLSGPLVRRQKRFRILLIANVLFILNCSIYFTLNLTCLTIARICGGLFSGFFISTAFLLTAEMNIVAASGLFLSTSRICYTSGNFLATTTPFFLYLDFGWYCICCFLVLFPMLHIIFLLIWGRCETPGFYLMIKNDEEKAKESLREIFHDEEMEKVAFEELIERKELRKQSQASE